MYVENTLCCKGSGLVSSLPWAQITVLCTQATAIPSNCLKVSGPPQGFVLTSQLNTNWSQTYRYTLSWAGDQYNSSFAGGVNVSIDATQSGCGLYINTCSLGGINYGAINSTVAPLSWQVVPSATFYQNLTGTTAADAWTTSNLAWNNATTGCQSAPLGSLTTAFWNSGAFTTWVGIQSTCTGNSSTIVKL